MKTTGMPGSGARKLLLVGVAALALQPGVVRAQSSYVVRNGSVTIPPGYCPQGAVYQILDFQVMTNGPEPVRTVLDSQAAYPWNF